MTDRTDTDTMPPLPHPERYFEWTAAEARAIEAWGRRLLAEARAQEREACAKLCDPEPVDPWDSYTARNNKATMRLLAQRIRARGDTAPDPRDERIARLEEADRG